MVSPSTVTSTAAGALEVPLALDSAAPSEPLKTYHNCEICVLRNGKGSREGIAVPKERPARYVEEKQEEDPPVPSFFSDFTPLQDLPNTPSDSDEEEKRSSRRRRGRRGGKSKGESAAQQTPAKAEAPNQEVIETKREQKDTPKAENSGSTKRRRGHRGGRGHNSSKPADTSANAPTAEKKPAQQPKAAPAAQPSAPKADGSEGAAKKRRHRGGRRHHSGGNNKTEG